MAKQRQLSAGHSLVTQMLVVKKAKEQLLVIISVARGGWIFEDLLRVVFFYDFSPRYNGGRCHSCFGAQTVIKCNEIGL